MDNEMAAQVLSGLIFFSFVYLLLAGCATTHEECEIYPVDSFEREQCQQDMTEAIRSIDRENWNLCYRVITEVFESYVVHYDHKAPHRDRGSIAAHSISSDLWRNHCKMILGDYWTERP